MKSYEELQTEIEAIQQQMDEAKKNEPINILQEEKGLWKEFDFIALMLRGSLTERQKKA